MAGAGFARDLHRTGVRASRSRRRTREHDAESSGRYALRMAQPFPVGRALDALMTALFVLSAAVQYNDPDPVEWMAIYLACAWVALRSALGHAPFRAALAVGAVALTWALTILPRVVGTPGFPTFSFGEGMKSVAIEETREAFGLLIGVTWMVVVALRARAGARPALHPPHG